MLAVLANFTLRENMLLVLYHIMVWIPSLLAFKDEPLCLSRYDYDYKVLRDIVDLAQEMKEMRKDLDAQKDTVSKQRQVIEQLEESIKDGARQTNQRIDALDKGSTYVRWGRTTCPGNGTDLVYAGYAAGSYHNHPGSAANNLCLPSEPLWGDYDDGVQNLRAFVYGAEYEISGSHSTKLFKKNMYNNDAPCAVCRSSRASHLFLPGRNACYPGWTLEYSGYLIAGYHGHPAASEFVCLDGEAEFIPGGGASVDGRLFYMAEATCGALKCPPYVNGRELTCAICTR